MQKITLMDALKVNLDKRKRERNRYPMLCDDCGQNYADPPGRTCVGCDAYREHQS